MRRLTLVAALLLHSISSRGCAKDLVAPTSECSLEGQLHNDSNLAKHDTQHMMVESASACRLECCKIPDCGGFTFAPRVDWPSKSCDLGTACCFLKDLATDKGVLTPAAGLTSGLVRGGRHPGPAPAPHRPSSPKSCGTILQELPCEQAGVSSHLRCWWNGSHCDSYPIGPKGGGACSNSTDCFGGGDCVNGGCRCDATWTGPHCKHLHLLPIEAQRSGFPVDAPGPSNPGLPTNSTFTWGGALAEDDGTYHLFFTEWANHCPMTFNTFYTSTHIAHAIAPTPLGPWTRAGVAVPPAAGNPTVTRAPDGTWLLYFTNHRYAGKLRNCTGPVESWGPPAYYNRTWPVNKSDTCGSVGYGEPFGISLAHSKSLTGPWTIQYDVITVPATNPGGPAFLANGTMILPFQSWPKATPCQAPQCITIVTARGWGDFPYRTYPLGSGDGYSSDRSSCIERWYSNSSWAPTLGPHGTYGSVEDPSNIWRDKRGNLHVLMHQAHKGGRAWSEDNGSSWHYDYNTTSYPFSSMADDGTLFSCSTSQGSSRGEPRVLIEKLTGLPSVLSTVCFTGAGPPKAEGGESQYWSRILLQRINTRQ